MAFCTDNLLTIKVTQIEQWLQNTLLFRRRRMAGLFMDMQSVLEEVDKSSLCPCMFLFSLLVQNRNPLID